MKLDVEFFFEFALIPRIVLSWVMVREVGGGDIGNSFGIYSYDLCDS